MLTEGLVNRYRSIADEVVEMVFLRIDTKYLTGTVDYGSIFAQSADEFDSITEELKQNGTVAIKQESGDYYLLTVPIETAHGVLRHCRVRVFDTEHPERGYIDFEVKNYEEFKATYSSQPDFSILTGSEEMMKLKDPKFNVRAYFPSGKFE